MGFLSIVRKLREKEKEMNKGAAATGNSDLKNILEGYD